MIGITKLFIISSFLLIFASAVHAQTLTHSYVPGEVIVKYKTQTQNGSKINAQSTHQKVSGKNKLRLKNRWNRQNTYNYKIESSKTVTQTINDLKADPEVEYAEPNYYVSMATAVRESENMSMSEAVNYADENYHSQMNEEGAQGLPYDQTGAQISIPESWAQLSGVGTQVVVAIIDTGIDFRNSLLVDAKWTNAGEIPNDGIDNDGNGYIDDSEGWNFVNNNNNPRDCNDHGTHVAGIIRGSTQDIIGVGAGALASTKVKLMALKFLDCDGIGTTSDAIEAIDYAIQNGAKILNNSWGGGAYSTALHEAIARSYNANTLFVAAAGNSGLNIDASPSYPASYNVPNVLSVGASNSFDYSAGFSNYGVVNVQIASPGVGVLSTVACNSGDITCSYTATMSGTSMAAPFIAGVATMMKWQKTSMIGYQIKNLLLDSVDVPLSGATQKLQGRVLNGGRVNSTVAVQEATGTAVDPSAPSYDVSANLLRGPASEAAGGCGLVQKVYSDFDNEQNNPPPMNPFSLAVVLVMFAVPVALAYTLSKNPKNQRRFERFYLGSSVQLSLGSSEYLGQVGTISLGGLSFSSQAVLKLGNPVHLKVESPDGKDHLKVDGHIVWMSNTQNYGVKFANTEEQALVKINEWTHKLKKAA